MPLAFQRPPQSMFAAQRMTKTITQNIPEEPPAPPPEPTQLNEFFRFFPLTPEAEHTKPSSGVAPVNPLTAPREAARINQQRGNFRQQQPQPQRPQHPQMPSPQQMQQPQRPQHPQMPPPQQMQQPQWPQHPQMPPSQQMQQPQWPQHPQMIPPQHMQKPPQPQMFAPPQPQPQIPPTQRQQMPPPSPPSPENAAQHFRNINKTLPDGVMYEPLDDETMRLLKDNGHLVKSKPSQPNNSAIQQIQQQPQTNIPQPQPAPTIPTEIAKTIENLAQNEHNAQIFYAGISFASPTDETKKSLSLLAEGSKSRVSQYIQILQTHFNSQFAPQKKDINTNLPFDDAISLAIIEENKALSTLCNLLDQADGTSLERQIERLISKKVVAHQILLTIHTTTIPAPRSLRYPPLSPDASL